MPASKRSGDDLVQRRIAGKRVGQLARLFGIRAAQLDRCGRAAALAVSRIEVEARDGLKVTPAAGFNRLNDVIAVERSRSAARIELVDVADAGAVEAGRQRDVPRGANRQHVGREDAAGIDMAVETDAVVVRLAIHGSAGDAVREGVQRP